MTFAIATRAATCPDPSHRAAQAAWVLNCRRCESAPFIPTNDQVIGHDAVEVPALRHALASLYTSNGRPQHAMEVNNV